MFLFKAVINQHVLGKITTLNGNLIVISVKDLKGNPFWDTVHDMLYKDSQVVDTNCLKEHYVVGVEDTPYK